MAGRNPGNAMRNVRKPGLFFHGMAKWIWRKVQIVFGQDLGWKRPKFSFQPCFAIAIHHNERCNLSNFTTDFASFLLINPKSLANSVNSYSGAQSGLSGGTATIAHHTFVTRDRNCICQSHTTPVFFLVERLIGNGS
jgi:hypothetical protein